jgi:hypothetical protein
LYWAELTPEVGRQRLQRQRGDLKCQYAAKGLCRRQALVEMVLSLHRTVGSANLLNRIPILAQLTVQAIW